MAAFEQFAALSSFIQMWFHSCFHFQDEKCRLPSHASTIILPIWLTYSSCFLAVNITFFFFCNIRFSHVIRNATTCLRTQFNETKPWMDWGSSEAQGVKLCVFTSTTFPSLSTTMQAVPKTCLDTRNVHVFYQVTCSQVCPWQSSVAAAPFRN